MKVKLKEWAKDNGISYKTALKQFKDGSIDGEVYESDTGRMFVIINNNKEIINQIDASIKALTEAKEKLKRHGI
jgi:predicted site-specific integrase-resolvase